MKVHREDRAYYRTKGTNEASLAALIAHITNFLSHAQEGGERGGIIQRAMQRANRKSCLESFIIRAISVPKTN